MAKDGWDLKTGTDGDGAKRFAYGPWLVAASAVLWSTSAFFARSPLFDVWAVEVKGAVIAFWRACFALVLLVPLIRRPSWRWAMLPMTLCFAAMNWTYLTALVGGPPANAIWLQNLAPVWVMLAAVMFMGEPTIRRDWWMLGFCISGVLLILVMEMLQPIRPGQANYWWAPWLAILSGILYAGVVLSLRKLRDCDSAWLIALNHIVTAFAMFPLMLFSGASWPVDGMWLLLIGIGVIQMGLPYFLFAQGLKSTPSHIASLITLLEPVLLPLWVHIARSHEPNYEAPHIWTWIGGGLILCGLAIRYALPTERSEKN